jgi:MFS superfamily sulfate permease-like transporter
MLNVGTNQFIPFIVTILAIVFTDLLIGISIGLAVGVFYVLKNNMQNTYTYNIKTRKNNEPIHIVLSEEVSFLNKASILQTLEDLPEGSYVIIDGSNSRYIDYDVLEIINDFKDTAKFKNIKLELIKIKDVYRFGTH